jgi:hypothetical protein
MEQDGARAKSLHLSDGEHTYLPHRFRSSLAPDCVIYPIFNNKQDESIFYIIHLGKKGGL